eukprot:10863719-Karenia_brevis.AAC.1
MHKSLSSCPRPLPAKQELLKDRPFPELLDNPFDLRSFWQKCCDDFDAGEVRKCDWAADVDDDISK